MRDERIGVFGLMRIGKGNWRSKKKYSSITSSTANPT
jgi:hypothetical protein